MELVSLLLLLVIAIELGMIYVKMPEKEDN